MILNPPHIHMLSVIGHTDRTTISVACLLTLRTLSGFPIRRTKPSLLHFLTCAPRAHNSPVPRTLCRTRDTFLNAIKKSLLPLTPAPALALALALDLQTPVPPLKFTVTTDQIEVQGSLLHLEGTGSEQQPRRLRTFQIHIPRLVQEV